MFNYFITLLINLLSIGITIFLIFNLINVKSQINALKSKCEENYGKTFYCNYNKSQFIWCIVFCILLSVNSIFIIMDSILHSLTHSSITSFFSLLCLSIVIFSQRKFCITEKGILPVSIFKGFLKQDFIPWNTTYSYEFNTSTFNRSLVIYYIKNSKKEKISSILSKRDLKIVQPLITDLYPKETK
ncbi:hypothetical protein SAMN02745163_03148 [Clostridium cavendishii DSM 21758]|uniref:Uncharacterized protein n=1 Tax=Clostridium cavendishii DSM 21758 TaxID=1121302 RepID=A0A1M6PGI6_9CLOT|nr:hypothetical protein [Clostridium cavendishii]SHK06997.1 hypothetical protein SAMN02745163_03148 [Clostridium cavendishii DSM 21758]